MRLVRSSFDNGRRFRNRSSSFQSAPRAAADAEKSSIFNPRTPQVSMLDGIIGSAALEHRQVAVDLPLGHLAVIFPVFRLFVLDELVVYDAERALNDRILLQLG